MDIGRPNCHWNSVMGVFGQSGVSTRADGSTGSNGCSPDATEEKPRLASWASFCMMSSARSSSLGTVSRDSVEMKCLVRGLGVVGLIMDSSSLSSSSLDLSPVCCESESTESSVSAVLCAAGQPSGVGVWISEVSVLLLDLGMSLRGSAGATSGWAEMVSESFLAAVPLFTCALVVSDDAGK